MFYSCCCVVFNVPPTAKVIWRRVKVSSDRLVKPGIEPATPGLQRKQLIHYTTAAPMFYNKTCVKRPLKNRQTTY